MNGLLLELTDDFEQFGVPEYRSEQVGHNYKALC